MEITQSSNRIHPLVAGAAASVILISLLGVAALAGILPNSHGTVAPPVATAAPIATQPIATQADSRTTRAPEPYTAPAAPVQHKHVVHHAAPAHAQPVVYAQAAPVQQYSPPPSPAPVYQQPAPAAQNSPIGIGVGAVIGGLLGNQVGGGNGRALATIAGAVGGGYIGNEVAKRNP